MPSSRDRKDYWTRRRYSQKQWGAKIVGRRARPSWFSSDVKAYRTLGLSFSLYTTAGQVTNGTNKNKEGTICTCPSSFKLHAVEVKKHNWPLPFIFLHEALNTLCRFLWNTIITGHLVPTLLVEEVNFYLKK